MGRSRFPLSTSQELALLGDRAVFAALERALPAAVVRRTIVSTHTRETRRWRLPAELVMTLVVALGLWSRESVPAILEQLVEGLRARDPVRWLGWRAPVKSSLTEARQRLGARPLRELFGRVARPLATPATPGAFRFGLRLMAIDGTTLTLPDSPANARAFGRPTTKQGQGQWVTTQGAWPLMRVVLLVECGTHAICDAILRPYRASEVPSGQRLLRSVTEGMLLLADRGFYSAAFIQAVLERGAHVLVRVRNGVNFPVEERLADGSYCSTIHPTWRTPRGAPSGLRVRVIEYVLDDPGRPKRGEVYRVVTTLLDPTQAPARELAATYHERWEHEGVNDEFKTHQNDRAPGPLVRSRRPAEVVQEVYGLLVAHWAIRALMVEAAAEAQIDPDRLSFVGALRVLRRAVPRFLQHADHPETTPFCSRPCATRSSRTAASPVGTATIPVS